MLLLLAGTIRDLEEISARLSKNPESLSIEPQKSREEELWFAIYVISEKICPHLVFW